MDVIQSFPYKCEQFIPFGLKRSAEHDLYCAASRTKAHILELIYSHHCDVKLFIEQSVLTDLSSFMPSHGIPKNAASIFNKASKPEQDQILIDFHLMSEELKCTNERVALVNTCWSPTVTHLPGNHYLAYLTNFGGCEIRQKHTGKRLWCIVMHNVAKEWMMRCQKTIKHTITTYQGLEDAVFNMQIRAISWNNVITNNPIFSIITADGTLAFFECSDKELRFTFQKQITCKKITAMEWFSFNDRNNVYRSFVITSELNGTVKLFSIQMDDNNVTDVIEGAEVFCETDGIPANGIQWEYVSGSNQLMIIFCKTMHIFVHLVDIETGALGSMHSHYIGHSTINSITRKHTMEYIVGTLNGHIECLKIMIKANSITTQNAAYKQFGSHTKYALYGLATSTNNAFILMAFFAARPYDHLVLREPAIITVCHQLGGLQALERLLSNPTKSLSTFHDLAEAVRCAQLKNDKLFRNYLEKVPAEIVCDNEYLYSLKIRLIIASARSTYLKQKSRITESSNLLGEYDIAKRFIFAIRSYQTLSMFLKNKKHLNDLQIISAQCHRVYLRHFVELSIFEEYEAVKVKFHPAIETMLGETKFFDGLILEKCTYCEEPIEVGQMVCNDGHEFPRCCITQIQIPVMNQRQCTRCHLFAIDDIEILKLFPYVLEVEGELVCPLCDSSMIRPHHLYYNNDD